MSSPTSAVPEADPAIRQAVDRLVELLRLEQLEHNLFRGVNADVGSPAVFGGQVLGQALMAAARTVDGPSVHSLHGYFLRAGDKAAPIVYDVDRIRDGKSFATRRVVAIQHGQAIFHMSASFQRYEDGAEHQTIMPRVPGPEGLEDEATRQQRELDRLPARMHDYVRQARAVEFRNVDPLDSFEPEARPPEQRVWLRVADRLPDDPLIHQALLAFASDYSLMKVAMLPHRLNFVQPGVQGVSLDHAMWFHRDFRLDDWLLYATDSPSLAHARGFCRGGLWTRDGRLVASVAQEGLIRVRR